MPGLRLTCDPGWLARWVTGASAAGDPGARPLVPHSVAHRNCRCPPL